MANENALAAFAGVANHFHVYLGDQRAGGVEYLQLAALCFLLHGLGYAMGAEDDDGVIRHFVELFHKHRPALTQIVHHITVVDHLVAHIDRRPEHFQRPVDDIDGAIHPGTEATGIGESDLHRESCVTDATIVTGKDLDLRPWPMPSSRPAPPGPASIQSNGLLRRIAFHSDDLHLKG